MSDVNNAAPGGGEGDSAPIAAVTPADANAQFSSPMSAAKALAELRWNKHREKQASEAAPVEAAPEAAPELADEANAAPPDEAPGETTETTDPVENLPPIEPPRSWTKEARERFNALPRETQEYLATREQERDREVRRSQNEAAEQRKAIDAERQRAEQARQQYEAALPTLMQTIQEAQAGAFADIRTVDDVTKLASEDPLRYLQWQAHQTKMQAVQQEMHRAQERQSKEKSETWGQFVTKENQLFIDRVPEFADKAKAAELTAKAVDVLHDVGFADQELAEMASGRKSIPIHDHRFQLLLLDGIKYREAQKARQTVAAKQVPPVQRPGTAKPKGAGIAEEIQNLSAKLERTGSLKDAQALRAAQLKQGRRA